MLTTKIIGNKIVEARKKNNISQAQLAERLFITSQAVGKWERGESLPDIITLNRLAEILGVDLNYFSENFQSANSETESVDSDDKQSDELPAEEQNRPVKKATKKLNWDMSSGNWVDADFSGLKGLNERFSSSNMQRCQFIGSELSGLLLKGNNVDSCDFSGSDFSKSHIKNSNLANNLFKTCSLTETEFSGSNVSGCDFTGASLSETRFSTSNVSDCDLTGADLTGMEVKSGGFEKNTVVAAVWNRTSFIDSWLVDMVFEGTMEDCSFENCKFKKMTFRNATLINTFFKNNNLKRISFIDCKADRMTYAFLKNGRADLSGITLLTSEEGIE